MHATPTVWKQGEPCLFPNEILERGEGVTGSSKILYIINHTNVHFLGFLLYIHKVGKS